MSSVSDVLRFSSISMKWIAGLQMDQITTDGGAFNDSQQEVAALTLKASG